jgi:hypothetical protein
MQNIDEKQIRSKSKEEVGKSPIRCPQIRPYENLIQTNYDDHRYTNNHR